MDENTNQVAASPQEYIPEEESAESGFPIKKILSLVIGLIVVLGIIAVVVFFVIPRFSPKKSENVTLTYWSIWEDSNALEQVASEFTRINPNIKVTIEKQDIKASGKHVERLATRINNGTGPDIFRYHNSWVTELLTYMLPLPQEVVKATELDSKFYPVVAKDLKVNGAYYGVPIHFDTLALFVNTEIFKNNGVSTYPSTWFDLTSVSKQLTVKDADNKILTSGIALGTYDNIAHASDIISLLMIQNGADLKDLSGKTKGSAADTLDFYTSFAKGEGKVWDDTIENSKLAFANGSLAMYIGYSWDIFEIRALSPNLSFATLPVPHLPLDQKVPYRSSTVASYWVEGVSSKTTHPKEAFEFLKFLASKESMEKLYAEQAKTRLFGELYPRSDMAKLLSDNTIIYPFVEQGENAQSTIFSSDTFDEAMTDGLNAYLGNAVRAIINDNSSPESAVETLSAGVKQIYSRYGSQTE